MGNYKEMPSNYNRKIREPHGHRKGGRSSAYDLPFIDLYKSSENKQNQNLEDANTPVDTQKLLNECKLYQSMKVGKRRKGRYGQY